MQTLFQVGRALRASRSFLPPGTARLCGASSGHAGLRTRIIFLLFTLHCSLLAPIPARASQPPFRGQYQITAIDGNTNTGWRIIGTFDDSSPLGYGAADATNGDLLYNPTAQGDTDIYRITNIVAVTGINLTCDVVYNESGAPRSGGPQAGYSILARPGYAGQATHLPSLTWGLYSQDALQGAANANLYYAYKAAYTNGGGGSGDVAAWSGSAATQEVFWIERTYSNSTPDTNTLIVTGNITPDCTGEYTWMQSPYGDWGYINPYSMESFAIIYTNMGAKTEWCLNDPAPPLYWGGPSSTGSPEGEYIANGVDYGEGTATVAYARTTTTNETIWRAGYSRTGRYWHISRDGVIVVNATNVATLADYLSTSNLLDSVTGRLAEAENTLDITTNALSVLATNTATKAQGDLATSALQIEADTNALAQLAIHADNTNNPHAVSAQQIGAITGATITGGTVVTNDGILDFVVTGDDYGIKEIPTTEYAVALEDNKWTLVQKSQGSATYTLPTIESAPFGYAITIVKGTNYPLQVIVTNAGGILFDGTNLYNNSSAKMHLISLKCIASNTWIINSLTGTWETQ